jgi:hypothetical protein
MPVNSCLWLRSMEVICSLSEWVTLHIVKFSTRPLIICQLERQLCLPFWSRAQRERWLQKLDRLRNRGATVKTGVPLQEILDDIRGERC